MQKDDLIRKLQAGEANEVRVAFHDSQTWPGLSTEIVDVVDHVGAYDEGAYLCLTIQNCFGLHLSSRATQQVYPDHTNQPREASQKKPMYWQTVQDMTLLYTLHKRKVTVKIYPQRYESPEQLNSHSPLFSVTVSATHIRHTQQLPSDSKTFGVYMQAILQAQHFLKDLEHGRNLISKQDSQQP